MLGSREVGILEELDKLMVVVGVLLLELELLFLLVAEKIINFGGKYFLHVGVATVSFFLS